MYSSTDGDGACLEYICLKTKPVANFPTDVPIIHNPDERFYVQPLEDQSVLIGGFLRESKPIFANGVPDTFNYSLLPDNWDDFRKALVFGNMPISNSARSSQIGFSTTRSNGCQFWERATTKP